MRLASIRTDRGLRLHVKGTAGYVDLADASDDDRLSTLTGVLAAGDAGLGAARRSSELAVVAIEKHRVGPATPDTPRILCLGVNYAEHAIEGGRDVPKWPESFVRGTGSVIGHYDDLVAPALTERLDYEAEVAVVIGKGGRYIRASDAFEAILGYAAMNDGSAASGSARRPCGPRARTSRARCPSALRWSPSTRSTSPTSPSARS